MKYTHNPKNIKLLKFVKNWHKILSNREALKNPELLKDGDDFSSPEILKLKQTLNVSFRSGPKSGPCWQVLVVVDNETDEYLQPDLALDYL